jgi:hypothetical protein
MVPRLCIGDPDDSAITITDGSSGGHFPVARSQRRWRSRDEDPRALVGKTRSGDGGKGELLGIPPSRR